MSEENKEVLEQEVVETPQEEKFDRESFLKGDSTEEVVEDVVEEEVVEEKEEVVAEKEILETPVVETASEYEADDYWSSIQTALSTDDTSYEIPESIKTGKDAEGNDLTKEEKFKVLTGEILKNVSYSQSPEINSYVKNLLSSSTQEDFSLGNYIKQFSEQVNTRNLPMDERLFIDAKTKYGKTGEEDSNGMSDTEIKEEIGKWSKFQKMDAIKVLDKGMDDVAATEIETNKTDYNKSIDDTHTKLKKGDTVLMNNYIKRIKGSTSVDGIELGEADHAQFIKEIPAFFEKKVVTNPDGYKYVTSEVQEQLKEVLGSPENSMHLLSLLWMAQKGKLHGYTSSVKEAAKKKVEDKFVSNVKTEKELSVTTEFNRERFMEGEAE